MAVIVVILLVFGLIQNRRENNDRVRRQEFIQSTDDAEKIYYTLNDMTRGIAIYSNFSKYCNDMHAVSSKTIGCTADGTVVYGIATEQDLDSVQNYANQAARISGYHLTESNSKHDSRGDIVSYFSRDGKRQKYPMFTNVYTPSNYVKAYKDYPTNGSNFYAVQSVFVDSTFSSALPGFELRE